METSMDIFQAIKMIFCLVVIPCIGLQTTVECIFHAANGSSSL